ncbi:50S ribosomal protein L21 [Gemmata obscuriglobus]|uniref:Large ribosomal subunit protein bL21 n=1 Tax=Gemmata obscuriglobus TaxID=114 RepID=A0A2Z3GXU4_9BACT|nr:50S ribosomal protein L21 [Gemmata obscuriglobus]AWM37461.1 50S ribosomal protein L21 [Gemmata obscuriglobus]QEG29772.1 50S ribosomal protein L21 [Gemmata obscuriglobus]VTS09089.1 50s ribosomal protein l21 : 50S ribosomal protein L21 OS=Planctomyces limnophilus (strain ATCC 43296 / DSM 3776 / IFAM 1008 / 290) GN=rplU PE=3 SV=1: Ribosomal_L21p [Gemmata obscuriglobus UQM 2246]
MYAIFEDGSRQYRVEPGSTVKIDFREAQLGQRLELPKVLLLSTGADTVIGRPLVEGARVLAEVIDFPRVKTLTQRLRRRKASRRLKGHTQPHVKVKITHILNAGEATPAEEPKPARPEAAPAPAAS